MGTKDQKAEARLERLVEMIATEEGFPTKDSDMSLYQAFLVFGLEAPELPEVNLGDIREAFGFPGWLLSALLGDRVRRRLEETLKYLKTAERNYRNHLDWIRKEAGLRQYLLRGVAYSRTQAEWRTKDEAKEIRDRTSRAASKTRDETVRQLKKLLQLVNIRLLEKQLAIAKNAGLDDQVSKLQDALRRVLEEATIQFGDIERLVVALADLDVTVAPPEGSPKKPKR